MRANQPELGGGGGEYHEDEETTMKRYLYIFYNKKDRKFNGLFSLDVIAFVCIGSGQ